MAKFHAVVITTLLALFAQGVTAGPQLVKCSDCVNAGHTCRGGTACYKSDDGTLFCAGAGQFSPRCP
ncbi:uncharacterized protein SETTUDRAFT_177110 [Exserohilum turcica Et28A]|uniref:Uncharacterized protein n=1 Tax=Exserohilum turcicum (strain 28A) TaxID=671987 RepID=R0ISM7_EXST2|nr:uncharacterized protein SETTUDRAFT_177110 [Exserohilum turcica Et28A]EOA87850.1 hypothetical protein SETTUDRAFT_177110 [Exserohilum turcica Et28A]